MVRFTLKRSLREESCCSLLVVKGGVALRRRSFFPLSGQPNRRVQAPGDFLRFLAVRDFDFLFAFAQKACVECRRLSSGEMGVDRPVFFLLEGFDLAFAIRRSSAVRRSAPVRRKARGGPCPTKEEKPDSPRGDRARVEFAARRPDAIDIAGWSKAALTARCVISLKVTRRMRASSPMSSVFALAPVFVAFAPVFDFFFFLPDSSPSSSARWAAMASPSRSGSGAR